MRIHHRFNGFLLLRPKTVRIPATIQVTANKTELPDRETASDCLPVPGKSHEIETENLANDLNAFLHPENHKALEIVTAIRRLDGYISADGQQILEKLVREHEDPDVRLAALNAITDRSFYDVLLQASKDENRVIREAALSKMADFEEDFDGTLFSERIEEIVQSETDEGILLTALQYCQRFASSPDEFFVLTHILLQRDNLPESFIFTYLDKLTDYEISPGFAESLFTSPVMARISRDEQELIRQKIYHYLKHLS